MSMISKWMENVDGIDAVKTDRATKQFDADFKIPQEEKKSLT